MLALAPAAARRHPRPRAHPPRDRGPRRDPRRGGPRRGARVGGRPRARRAARTGRALEHGPGRRRAPRGGPGDPHRVARGRPARGRARSRRSDGAATQSAVVRDVDRSCRRPPRSSARSPGARRLRACPTSSSASIPSRCRRSTRRPTRRRSRIAKRRRRARRASRPAPATRQVNGTGVVVARGYLVTNAHVVAGASTVRATLGVGGRRRGARPVRSQTSTSPSSTRPTSPRPALRFATTDPERGRRGRGPRLRRRRAARRAAGRGRRRVPGDRPRHLRRATWSPREIVELRAAIEPGDSGGPLVLEDGTVGGLVFAESRADPEVGYALSPTAVATRIGPAIEPDGHGRRRGVPRLSAGADRRPRCTRGRYDLPMDVTADQAAGDAAATLDASRRTTGTPTSRRTREFATAHRRSRGSTTVLADPTPEGAAATRARLRGVLARAGRIDAATRSTPTAGSRWRPCASRLGSDIAQLDTGLLDDWNVNPLEGMPASFLLIPDYQRLETADGRRAGCSPAGGRWRRARTGTSTASAREPRRRPRRVRRAGRADRQDPRGALLGDPDDDWPLLAPLDDLDDARRRGLDDRRPRALRRPSCARSSTARSGRPSSGSTTPSSTRSCRTPARRSEPGIGHVAGGARRLPAAHPRPHVARPRRRRRSTRSASTRSPGSTPRSPTSPGRTLGTREPRGRAGPPPRRTRRSYFDDRATRSSTRRRLEPRPRERGDPRTGSAGCPRPRARSCAWARTRRSTRRSRTTASRRSTARGPASTSSTPRTRRPGRATRPRPSPTTRPSPATTCRSRSARSSPHLPEFRRHLGPTAFFEGWGLYTERLSDEMGLYAGDLDRIGVLSFDAWRAVAARRRHRDARARLDARPGDPVHARPHGPRAEQHRERGRPVHREAGPGPRLQDRASSSCSGCATRRRRPSAAGSTSAASTTPCWATAPSPCRRSAASSRRGPARCSTRPDAGATPGPRRHRTAAPLALAARSLASVLRNRDIRSLEACWTLGIAADWALLVVALLVAYDAGGAVLVGLVSLIRMIPATVVNLLVDTGPLAAARSACSSASTSSGPAGAVARRGGQPRRRHAPRVRGGRARLGGRGAGAADRPDAPAGGRREPVRARQREHRGRARREPRHVRRARSPRA